MSDRNALALDERIMRRCFEVAERSARDGGYPYSAIIARGERTISEATNRVSQDHDVTRHAEIVALVEAQRKLATTSLDDCALYAIVEPCAMCSYAIREARIALVAFGLSSPVMGGQLRWNILGDSLLSSRMPEVFAPPPDVVAGFLADEAAAAFQRASPLMWAFARSRDLLRGACDGDVGAHGAVIEQSRRGHHGLGEPAMRLLRRMLFDRFGRSGR